MGFNLDGNMATYASNSNPFIRSGPGNLELSAPGMAKPITGSNDNFIPNQSRISHATEINQSHIDLKNQEIVREVTEKLVQASVDQFVRLDINEPPLESFMTTTNETIYQDMSETFAQTTTPNESCCITDAGNDQPENLQEVLDDDRVQNLVDNKEGLVSSLDRQGTQRLHHLELIRKLRLQLRDLEQYAFERGELDQVPASVLAERQSVILDAVKERLSLRIGSSELEKLKLDELKEQVEKEIQDDLIDPMVTKEFLLTQMKTQLTDLERYIAHLHNALGKKAPDRVCSCDLHRCSISKTNVNNKHDGYQTDQLQNKNQDSLPSTSRFIRTIVTQLLCTDMKLQEMANKQDIIDNSPVDSSLKRPAVAPMMGPINSQPTNDGAIWTLHMDKVILATDSLVNLFTIEPQYRKSQDRRPLDETLVESVVRRQLIPAIRELLGFGLIDPESLKEPSYYSLFDPYSLLASLTCLPGSRGSNTHSSTIASSNLPDQVHVWHVIKEFYDTRCESEFKTSSLKTLSKSFDLVPEISGPIQLSSRQALLIAVDDVIETLSKCKPNGPESHLRLFTYTALNRSNLAKWLRLIYRSKHIVRKFYHSHSFVSQPEKMEKLLSTLEPLSQFEFKLKADVVSIDRLISAF